MMSNLIELRFLFIPFYLTYCSIRIYWALRARRRVVVAQRNFLFDQLNIWFLNFLIGLFPVLALLTNVLRRFDYPAQLPLMLTGILFLVSGLILVWQSHRDLDVFWSGALELKQEHRLIRHGVYRSMRHPMYLSFWLWTIGQAMCVPNYLGGLSALIFYAIFYFVRIEKEEQMLVDRFGNEYVEYRSVTPRLFPKLRTLFDD